MNWNDENIPIVANKSWWHATVSFPGDAGMRPRAAAVLSETLSDRLFHFLRKEGKLRLRTERPAADLLDQLVDKNLATGWVSGVYEPEIDAFGGPEAMDIAHQVFCADSRAALAETDHPYARERCVLLISAMNRASGLDPFEIGDVWAKLARLRPEIKPPTGGHRAAAVAAMRRLMNADATQRHDTEPGWAERVDAFEEAGRRLAQLATEGLLRRGLRAVLAHHAIFTFNRAAVPVTDQAAAAWLGRHVAFGDEEPTDMLTSRSTSLSPSLERMEATITPDADPAELREAMVAALTEGGHLRTPAIVDAFRHVERHRFIPEADLQDAYINDAVSVKHDETGEMISCISAPSIVATQLEQLGARPGHNVLEAGAATGYNAALVARLVAPGGQVWTVDVDQDLVNGAAEHLTAAGAPNATVVLADGAAGLPAHAPYDRIQFTVGYRGHPHRGPGPARTPWTAGHPDADPRQHLAFLRVRARRQHLENRLL